MGSDNVSESRIKHLTYYRRSFLRKKSGARNLSARRKFQFVQSKGIMPPCKVSGYSKLQKFRMRYSPLRFLSSIIASSAAASLGVICAVFMQMS